MEINDGILLYHGSYTEVSIVDLKKCKDGLDFGRGFYVTSDYGQAMNYVPSAVNKAKRTRKIKEGFRVGEGRVSIYRYHANPQLMIQYFPKADIEWLHFVTANRDHDWFPELVKNLGW